MGSHATLPHAARGGPLPPSWVLGSSPRGRADRRVLAFSPPSTSSLSAEAPEVVQSVLQEAGSLGGRPTPSPGRYQAAQGSRGQGRCNVHTTCCLFASLAHFLTVLGKVGEIWWPLHTCAHSRTHTHILSWHRARDSRFLASAEDETRRSSARRGGGT